MQGPQIEVLLALLDKVKPIGKDRWHACCPAHQDKNPSMHILWTPERILLNCKAGCTTLEVLQSLGLNWDALHPPRERGKRPPFPSAELLKDLAQDSLVLMCATRMVLNGEKLPESDMARLSKSVERFQKARTAQGVRHAG